MGSAQSARRIQPGGASGRAGGFPGGSLFFPAPRFASRPPRGPGVGVGGGPPPGRLSTGAAGRTSSAAVRRDRLRDGWEGPAGKVARGGPASPVAPELPRPECYSPPAAALAESRGRGSDPSPCSPPASPSRGRRPFPRPPRPLRGAGVRCGGQAASGRGEDQGGRAAPPTARPLSHPPLTPSCGGRAGRTVPSAPRASSRRRVRGSSTRVHAERTGSAAMSATHPTRLETRTKESDACASQGLERKPPWRNEGEEAAAVGFAPLPAARGGIPRPRPVRRGRTTGPSRPPRRGGGARAHASGPERW